MVIGESTKAKELRLLVQAANMKFAESQNTLGFTSMSLFEACMAQARS